MKRNYYKYIDLLLNRKMNEAKKFRKKMIPEKIYKYVSLDKNNDLNNSKINGLINNEIWMSRPDNLNDPFEFKGVFLDVNKLKEGKFPDKYIEAFKKFLRENKNRFLISSYTTTSTNNMPMWAHYSNNHKGFCIEFDVINSSSIYPVFYEKERVGIARIIADYYKIIDNIKKSDFEDENSELHFYSHLFMIMGLQKHQTWSYEDEYRVLIPNPVDDENGKMIPLKKQGLSVNSVFIGLKCNKENEIKIKQSLKQSSIDVYKMTFEEDNNDYELIYK